MEVLLNLCAAISHHTYSRSSIMDDFYAVLRISSNIRDDFIGPFHTFPVNIAEKLISYSEKRNMSDVIQSIDKYTERTTEISEFISLKMSAALPFIYDKFVLFLIWRPKWNVQPVDEFDEILQSVYQTIMRPGGIYDHLQYISKALAKNNKIATQLKDATLETIHQLFGAIDHNNETLYNELKVKLQNQLSKLCKEITVTIQTLRRLKIKEILSKLSTVHKRLYKTALDIFSDDLENTTQISNESHDTPNETTLIPDSLRRETSPPFKQFEQAYQRFFNHSRNVFYLYLILFVVFFLCIYTRFYRHLNFLLWKYFH